MTRPKYARRFKNTVRLDKTWQLHQRIRCNNCNMANRERKQAKRAVFSFVLQLCTLPLNICYFGRVQNEQTFFEGSKIYENILDTSNQVSKHRVHFGRVIENVLLYFNFIFDASCTFSTLNYSSIFPRRVENVQDASPKYATIFLFDFGIFWTRLLNLATRQLDSATRQNSIMTPMDYHTLLNL